MDDLLTLITRIDSLLQAPPESDDADVRAHMETTLTDGYARALALEAELWRLQREIGGIAADLAEGGDARTKELASLARRFARSEKDLTSLRQTLVSLRERIALAANAALIP
jgi:uncharacterized protein involved in exopolysaccharide biosynthesis